MCERALATETNKTIIRTMMESKRHSISTKAVINRKRTEVAGSKSLNSPATWKSNHGKEFSEFVFYLFLLILMPFLFFCCSYIDFVLVLSSRTQGVSRSADDSIGGSVAALTLQAPNNYR